MLAAALGHTQLVSFLINAGANNLIQRPDGETALTLAERFSFHDVVGVLKRSSDGGRALCKTEATETDPSADIQLQNLPRFLICPLTLEVFRDPVVAASGMTYERSAITAWLRQHSTDPVTNLKVNPYSFSFS
jgi:hypothetical protein